MAEPSEDPLLREIDEELRHEQAAKLWKTYGNYVIGVAIAVVVAVAGYQGWRHWDLSARRDQGGAFLAAERLASAGDADAAAKAFAELAREGKAGYALLARFREAAIVAEGGDTAGAAAAYRAIAGDSAAAAYRELATVLAAMHDLDSGGDAAAIVSSLAPLTGDASPWRFSAREITAMAHAKLGDMDKAHELFSAIALDPGAPQSLRDRARELTRILDQ